MRSVASGASRITPVKGAALATLLVLATWSSLAAAPIETRLVEGTAHGLMLVRSVSGEIVGHGDFLQAARGDHVESRLVLRFKDGSLHDETIALSQHRVFTMLNYRLVQRGPSFPETLEAVLDRKTGSYTVRSTRRAATTIDTEFFSSRPWTNSTAAERARPT